jgi:hypothetical protein
MALHIVVGMRTVSTAEEEHLLYLGRDGVKALEAAARAMDSGEYVNGRIKRQVIYTWIPCATVPAPRPKTKPADLKRAAEAIAPLAS